MWLRDSRLDCFENLLREVLKEQRTINPKLETFMSTSAVSQAQFTTDLNTLNTKLTQFITDVQAEVAALKAANPGVDFSSLDSIVTGMSSQVQTADAATGSTPAKTS